MTHKFDLFIGYLGNGATVCNKAVQENGDYKTVAHISNAGNIKLYVKPDYIPPEDMNKIKALAAEHREKALNTLALELSTSYGYSRTVECLADTLPLKEMGEMFDKLKTLAPDEKKTYITQMYLANF